MGILITGSTGYIGAEVVRILLKKGIELGVPYELTWSCYTKGPTHCGECESCNNRKKAFTKSGITDKTKYLK